MFNFFSRFFLKKSKPLISDTGGWIGVNEHYLDQGLIDSIIKFCTSNNVVTVNDLGSGSQAKYSLMLDNSGFSVHAYDYNPEILKVDRVPVNIIDLTKVQSIKKSDLTICLEVGEHIPPEYENILIENILSSSDKYLILSWAILGQDGHGHVNCKTNFDVIHTFQTKGWVIDMEETNSLRNASSLSWFKNTLFVFRNRNGLKS